MDHLSTETGNVATVPKNKPLISTQILAVCVVLIALAVTAVTVFKVSVGSLFFMGALLACPLIHVLMMRGMDHKHD
ncbi:hypothetical protein A2Z33_06230 [Candidatus Gottesmanbacteria bacterium RBG_16_52_11]|uniref:DUF2933 domain-containing protein n=1 Tax=Candidatus Gottesmanbacteria bacterium RBG_16_52_11 TaxID=1798374 RepID=A0A1F5YXG1_9BACT|nr:MAG: hypothetical protein A2Z33_06230 [Candidatus Gottesmanbacteria bacterium RBG_16_52_11]